MRLLDLVPFALSVMKMHGKLANLDLHIAIPFGPEPSQAEQMSTVALALMTQGAHLVYNTQPDDDRSLLIIGCCGMDHCYGQLGRPHDLPAGTRVACVANDGPGLQLIGNGEYLGNFTVGEEAAHYAGRMLRNIGAPIPKIKLDTGEIIWGCECVWMEEHERDEMIRHAKIENVPLNVITLEQRRFNINLRENPDENTFERTIIGEPFFALDSSATVQ